MDDLLRAAAVLAGFWLGGALPTWYTLRTTLRAQTAGQRALLVALWPVGWLLLARARYHTLPAHDDAEVQ